MSSNGTHETGQWWDRGLTRRDLLKLAGGSALVVSGGQFLWACGSTPPSASNASSSPSTSTPRVGGSLRVGVIGGGNADNLDPYHLYSNIDAMRYFQLYESLTAFDSMAIPQLLLAEEITPNSNATVWTIRVRPGIEFHNGKTLSADDVIFSLQRLCNPKNPGEGAGMVPTLDARNIKKIDKLTLTVPFTSPFATFFEVLGNFQQFMVVPVDFNPRAPIGTGPFMYKSFSPGIQSTFVRNPNYWETGKPYFDEVVITDYSDEGSQTNALLSGQIDAAGYLSTQSLTNLSTGKVNVTISASGGFNPIFGRADLKPWSDVRVRQAMRLIVNRPQMLDVVFGGKGMVGNDVTSIWDPFYDSAIPQRVQDLDQARSLLQQAGRQGNLSPAGYG